MDYTTEWLTIWHSFCAPYNFVDQFLHCFYCQNQEEICIITIIKGLITSGADVLHAARGHVPPTFTNVWARGAP